MAAAPTRRTEALSDEILTGTRTPAATAAGATPARGASRQHVSDVSSHLPAALAGVLDTIGLGLVTRWVRRQRARRRRFNPYIAGAPVFDGNMFFGREKLAAEVLKVLRHKSVIITGERRIGKTSFLHHLKNALAADEVGGHRFFPIFVDLEGVPESELFQTFMAEMVESLGLSPPTFASLRFASGQKGYDERHFGHDFQRVVEDLQNRTERKVKLALLIDEADVLGQCSERINERLLGFVSKTFSQNLVVVMAGVAVRKSRRGEVSPWHRFLEELEIPAFTRGEAEALVKSPVAGVFRYQPEAAERILELSRLRPYLIQKLCIHAVSRMLEDGRTFIRVSDVEAARGTLHQ